MTLDCQWLDVDRNASPPCDGPIRLVGFLDRHGRLVEQGICDAHVAKAKAYEEFHGASFYVVAPRREAR